MKLHPHFCVQDVYCVLSLLRNSTSKPSEKSILSLILTTHFSFGLTYFKPKHFGLGLLKFVKAKPPRINAGGFAFYKCKTRLFLRQGFDLVPEGRVNFCVGDVCTNLSPKL